MNRKPEHRFTDALTKPRSVSAFLFGHFVLRNVFLTNTLFNALSYLAAEPGKQRSQPARALVRKKQQKQKQVLGWTQQKLV